MHVQSFHGHEDLCPFNMCRVPEGRVLARYLDKSTFLPMSNCLVLWGSRMRVANVIMLVKEQFSHVFSSAGSTCAPKI